MTKIAFILFISFISMTSISQNKCWAIDVSSSAANRTLFEGCTVNLKFKDGLKTKQGLILRITADSITITKSTTWKNSLRIYGDTVTKAIKQIKKFSSPSLIIRGNAHFKSRIENTECYQKDKNCTY